MQALFDAVLLSDLEANIIFLLSAFVGVFLLFLGYRYISGILRWNSMIDRRNSDMGSDGWKYGKKGFWN